jgi:Flp pilus assembly protein TadG
MSCRLRPSGQALVEFALVLPLILFISLGGISVGIVILHRLELEHAAQQVANEAAYVGCDSAAARAGQVLGYQPEQATCSTTGQLVTVDLAHSWPALLPFVPETISVEARAFTREPVPLGSPA